MFKRLFLLSFLFVATPVYAGKGMVEITSEPLGAKIFLNGQRKGSTPQQAGKPLLLELEEGEYKLEGKTDDGGIATFDLFVASGAIQPVHLVLEKLIKVGDKFVKVGESFKDCPECPEMVFLAGGAFKMGSNKSDDEEPVHEVKIKSFAMGKFEVKVGQYLQCVSEGSCNQPEWLESGNEYNINTGHNDYYKWTGMSENSRNHPIVGISWNDATKYAQWLSKKTGKNYRLPTEAEWEYAARAGTQSKWSFGDNESELKDYAWYRGNSYAKYRDILRGKVYEVGQKKPNEFGLFDVHGNAQEWTCSDYGKYSESKQLECSSNNNARKTLRGGFWGGFAGNCRSATRYDVTPDFREYGSGFRVALAFPL